MKTYIIRVKDNEVCPKCGKNPCECETTDTRVLDIKPHKGESKEDFISRFMSETKEEYPDNKQRLAVAYSYWKNAKDSNDVDVDKELDSLIADEEEAIDEYNKAIKKFESDKELMYMCREFEKIIHDEEEHIRILKGLKESYNR